MRFIVLFSLKFKQDQNRLIKILNHHGFEKISESAYIGELASAEEKKMKSRIRKIETEKGSVLMIPICKKCFGKIEEYGKGTIFEEQNYMIL